MATLVSLVAFAALAMTAGAGQIQAASSMLVEKQQLYVGTEPCNNGEVTTYEKHKGCGTRKIGYTIDDASATPKNSFVEVFAGNDVVNNKIVSKNFNHLAGSMVSIGFLSKEPVPGGTKLYSGNEPCNNGTATPDTLHKGCGTEFLGYTLPQE